MKKIILFTWLLVILPVFLVACSCTPQPTATSTASPPPIQVDPQWKYDYAPVIYLQKDERLAPTGIGSYLNLTDLMSRNTNNPITSQPGESALTADNNTFNYLDLRDAYMPGGSSSFSSDNTVYVHTYNLGANYPDVVYEYWFFYPYDNWNPPGPVFDRHEGDWEMVAIVVNKQKAATGPMDKAIEWAGYSQHFFGCKYYPSPGVDPLAITLDLVDGTHPKVFVGKGSHANFASNGIHPAMLENAVFFPLSMEFTSKDAKALYPPGHSFGNLGTHNQELYDLQEISDSTSWAEWLGRWGEQKPVAGLLFASPQSPGVQKGWDNPLAWALPQTTNNIDNVVGLTGSPVHLIAYDSLRNRVGLNATGQPESTIPLYDYYQPSNNNGSGLLYYQPSSDNGSEIIAIATKDSITFEIDSTLADPNATSTFDFAFGQYIQSKNLTTVVDYEGVRITKGTKATVSTDPAKGYDLHVDLYGDNTTTYTVHRTSIYQIPKLSNELLNDLPWVNNLVQLPSNITDMAVSQQVAYATTNSTVNPIFKSTDNGSTWSRLNASGLATLGAPALVAAAPGDPNTVLVAGDTNEAYLSTNGGANFSALTGHGLTTINAVAISPLAGGVRFVTLAGTSGGTADVAYLNLGVPVPTWVNVRTAVSWNGSALTGKTVLALGYSPSFVSDKTMTAVTATANATYFEILNFSSNKTNASAGFTSYPVQLLTEAATTADISLAPSYLGADTTLRVAFVATATGGKSGKLQRLRDINITNLKTAVDIKSVAYNGTKMVAGSNTDNSVYYSTNAVDPVPTVSTTSQKPAGSKSVSIAWAGTNVIAGTEGPDSTIAVSTDSGATFNNTN